MSEPGRYTAEQLANLAGVSLRTVRYYVQEELIDRPEARGPGAHFTDKHLRQLKRCKLLQDWGFDLETIRDRSGSFQAILDGFAIDTDFMRDGSALRAMFRSLGGETGSGLSPKQSDALKAAVESLRGRRPRPAPERKSGRETIPMADGIDLVVDRDRYAIPSPKDLVEIALQVRKSFDALKRSDDEDE
jgi:DNA-binding transcriptional MerR regulator